MLMTWDEPKRQTNLRVHRLDFADAQDRFDLATALIRGSYAGPGGRARFVALGPLDGRVVALIFSHLGSEAISVISLRPASIKERRAYDQAQG